MSYECIVNGCKGRDNLHKFPTHDMEILDKWCQNLKIYQILEKTKFPKICSRHFESSCLGAKLLLKGAIPTLHLGHDDENINLPVITSSLKKYRHCHIKSCTSHSGDFALYNFPSDPKERRDWLEACDLQGSTKVHLEICEKHFHPAHINQYKRRLTKDAFPIPVKKKEDDKNVRFFLKGVIQTLNLGYDDDPSITPRARKDRRCAIKSCTSHSGDFLLHSFPTDPKEREDWLEACDLQGRTRVDLRICQKHFHPAHITASKQRLTKDAFPIPVKKKENDDKEAQDNLFENDGMEFDQESQDNFVNTEEYEEIKEEDDDYETQDSFVNTEEYEEIKEEEDDDHETQDNFSENDSFVYTEEYEEIKEEDDDHETQDNYSENEEDENVQFVQKTQDIFMNGEEDEEAIDLDQEFQKIFSENQQYNQETQHIFFENEEDGDAVEFSQISQDICMEGEENESIESDQQSQGNSLQSCENCKKYCKLTDNNKIQCSLLKIQFDEERTKTKAMQTQILSLKSKILLLQDEITNFKKTHITPKTASVNASPPGIDFAKKITNNESLVYTNIRIELFPNVKRKYNN